MRRVKTQSGIKCDNKQARLKGRQLFQFQRDDLVDKRHADENESPV